MGIFRKVYIAFGMILLSNFGLATSPPAYAAAEDQPAIINGRLVYHDFAVFYTEPVTYSCDHDGSVISGATQTRSDGTIRLVIPGCTPGDTVHVSTAFSYPPSGVWLTAAAQGVLGPNYFATINMPLTGDDHIDNIEAPEYSTWLFPIAILGAFSLSLWHKKLSINLHQ